MRKDLLWWTFQLPNAMAHVPAESIEQAREVLRRNSYEGAPVDKWPFVRWRLGVTRAELADQLLEPKRREWDWLPNARSAHA